MERSWLINSRGIAKKVKNVARSSEHQINDCGANRQCPNCDYLIDNSDVSHDWPGLPIGVKFEPTDEELVEHLTAKCGSEGKTPHMFIDEFIPTLDGEGIYSDHPKNLPGAKKDGSSVHFFHRIANAFATGQRKRRKVQSRQGPAAEQVRWHKTGKTKAVIENGAPKGWKKFLVLYKTAKKGSKPDKTNWVMHQYHLGSTKDEKEGDFVVSKICYQRPKTPENEHNNDDDKEYSNAVDELDVKSLHASPMTPISNPPIPPRHGKSLLLDDIADNNLIPLAAMEPNLAPKNDTTQLEDGAVYHGWLAGESQAVEDAVLNALDDSLLCKEIFDSIDNYNISDTNFTCDGGNTFGGESVAPSCTADLANINVDSPPDIDYSKLQFCSQDSLLDWFDKI